MIYDFILTYSVLSCKILLVMFMYSNELEEAFSNFLDRHEYDEAEAALFSVVRLAFVAGWRAAGGTPPQAERIYELLPPPSQKEERP